MAEMTHSPVGASSCERWWNCPGSNAFIARLPKAETSKFAAEGTAAHEVAEKVLTNRVAYKAVWPASSLVGEIVEADDYQFKVTEEMAESAELYANTILQDALEIGCTLRGNIEVESRGTSDSWKHWDKKTQDSIYQPWVNIEKSFELTDVDPEARGTNDASIQRPGEKLIVYDYKYGKGIAVEPVENKQMLYYAIGAAGENLMNFKTIELVIIQPRASHADGPVRRWATTPEYVARFKAELTKRIAKTREENAATCTGKWCRFCNAKMICPAMRTTVNNVAKMDFQAPVSKNVLRRPMELTPAELKLFLDNAEILETYISDVKAHAFSLLDSGGYIEGYKLVRSGKAHRKWTDESVVATMLELELGVDAEDLYNKTLKTPAQIEKMGKSAKATVQSYCYKPEGGLTLARDADFREKQIASSITDFADIGL